MNESKLFDDNFVSLDLFICKTILVSIVFKLKRMDKMEQIKMEVFMDPVNPSSKHPPSVCILSRMDGA
jgi:hypothetical protein